MMRDMVDLSLVSVKCRLWIIEFDPPNLTWYPSPASFLELAHEAPMESVLWESSPWLYC